MFKNIFTRSLVIATLVWAASFPPEIYGNVVEKRVSFAKGKGTVSYRGTLPRNSNYDAYIVPARKGRFLSVKLITSDREAYLAIYETKILGPDADNILANDERSVEWTGQIPVTGEYSVQVYDASENGGSRATYRIEITLL